MDNKIMSSPRLDIIVIGGGLMGLWPALLLARSGCAVSVLEADSAPVGASWAAAGMLAPASEAGEAGLEAEALGAFGLHSLALWRDWASRFAAAGRDIGWRPCGALLTAFDEAALAGLAATRGAARRLGMQATMQTPAQALSIEPNLASGLHGALLIEEEASVDPRRVLLALQALLAEAGGVLRTDMRAMAIEQVKGGLMVRCEDGQVLKADQVLLAAGYQSNRLSGFGKLPLASLEPVKGQMLALEARPGSARAVIRDARAYIVPRGDGRIIIGATSEPGRADAATDTATLMRLHRGAASVLPELAGAKMLEGWTGVRPKSADALPVIGPCGGGIFINSGHYRNGVLLAPASAAMVCAMMLDKAPGASAATFSPLRLSHC